MWKRWLGCVFVVLTAAAAAGEGEEPKPGPAPKPKVKAKEDPNLPAPTDDEVDKPGKPGVPRPTPIPAKEDEAAPEKESAKGGKPEHVNPFREKPKVPSTARPARITFSDKKVLEGHVWARTDKPLRVFDRGRKAHEDYAFSEIKRIDVKPETENFERDWRWKNQGSSEKVFLETGYFWNQYITTFTLSDGKKAEGDCSGQFYIQLLDGTRDKWYLYKRESARDLPGVPHKKREELAPLVYVKSVEFTDDFLKRAEPEKAPVPPKTDNR